MIDTRLPAPPGGAAATPIKVRRGGWAVAATAALAFVLAGPSPTASAAADPQGVWMIEDEVAIAVARCGAGEA